MTCSRVFCVWSVVGSILVLAQPTFPQGSLTPPGPPAPTFKTLNQVEPRTPITNLPYFITAPGSYYLVTNLNGGAGGGITISNSDVSVDLNGFALIGGTGAGISFTLVTNVAIRNGTVRGWSGAGVNGFGAPNSLFQNLRASQNGNIGLRISQGLISGCTAMTNGFNGIVVDLNSTVINCTASFNVGHGIVGGSDSTVVNCTASSNGGNGINGSTHSTLIGCTASSNTGTGIFASLGSTIVDCTASANRGDGIQVVEGCQVTRNTCYKNTAAGIHATLGLNRIEANHMTENGRGVQLTGGTDTNVLVRNTAGHHPLVGPTLASNYVFSGFTIFGPTNSLLGTGGVLTNQNPWANFSF